ncbi:uncharacterized protein blow [Chironomus tepperi]|uniref:uncharacterized protein blow n=1 Tax=Chironomus tepperi TaxID=113505 RepID=UPI00391FB9FB
MDRASRENVIKIKEFLEDIYMYLNNNITIKSYSSDDEQQQQQEEEDERQRHETKRRELIENCKHIRSLFENEFFHPHDVDSTISYLDMNGAAKNRIKSSISDENEIESSKEEYVDMSHRKSSNSRISENPYNIYEAAISLSNQDSEKCPFTGLPAVHLKLMCSPLTGLLTRLEKKLFFGQSKDFYAGILDKWILLYPSKSNDMAPSEYFYPKRLVNVKGENQFIIVTNNDKRYHFQAPNSQEYSEWIENINKILEENQNGRMRESQIPQLLSTRKLPSPPPPTQPDSKDNNGNNDDIENYYSFSGAPQSINSNEERLYEEPCSTSIDDNESPPKLPKKIGKRIIEEDEVDHEYDTPKSTKSLDETREIVHDNRDIENVPTQHNDNSPNIPRVKVSEMTAMLSGINLVSPEEKLRSNNMIRSRKAHSIEENIPNDVIESHKRKSPVKKWFRQTIMRSKRYSQKEKTPVIEETEEEMNKIVTSVKGSKVNMIINQLEKSGQLKALKKGLKSRKSLVYDNNEEYETVCVKNNEMSK